MVAPHLVEQLRAAVHTLGVLHEVAQQLEFGRPDLERLALVRHAVGGGIEQQIADGNAVAHLLGCAAAQHGADARQQLLGGERLGYVVVGTSVKASHLVRFVATRGQHEDGHGLGARIGAPFARQRQAALARQHPVEQDDVGQHGVKLTLRRLAVFGPDRLEAVVPQIDRHQLGDGGFVYPINWSVDQVNPLTLFDNTNVTQVTGLTVSRLVDLTGTATDIENYGVIDCLYSDYSLTNQHGLDFGLKVGSEYFLSDVSTDFRISTSKNLTTLPTGVLINQVTIKTYDGSNTLLTTVDYPVTGSIEATNFISPDLNEIVVATSSLNQTFWSDLYNKMKFAARTSVTIRNVSAASQEFNVSHFGSFIDSAITPDHYVATSKEIGLNPGGVQVLGTGGVPIVQPVPAIRTVLHLQQINVTMAGTTIRTTNVEADAAVILNYASDGGSVVIDVSNDKTASDDTGTIPTYIFNALFGHEDINGEGQTLTSYSTVIGNAAFVQAFKYLQGGAALANEAVISTFSPAKNYVHSWKSYSWDEEVDDDDFVEELAELDQQSFHLITSQNPAPGLEVKLGFMPWEQFRVVYDNASIPPSQPRIVTKDNTGRWRFYPPPNIPYTIRFDYVRNPQVLGNPTDIPKGLPADYSDIIMWRALMYYGEYDEQPSVLQRATRNYKDMLQRLELRFRDKFHFAPARLW